MWHYVAGGNGSSVHHVCSMHIGCSSNVLCADTHQNIGCWHHHCLMKNCVVVIWPRSAVQPSRAQRQLVVAAELVQQLPSSG